VLRENVSHFLTRKEENPTRRIKDWKSKRITRVKGKNEGGKGVEEERKKYIKMRGGEFKTAWHPIVFETIPCVSPRKENSPKQVSFSRLLS